MNDLDVVYVPAYVGWDAMRHRGGNFAQDRLAHRLLEGDEFGRVLLAEPWRSVAAPVVRRLRGQSRAPWPAGPGRHRFAPLRLRRADPTEPAAVRASIDRYDARLAHQVRRLGLRRPVVLTTNPLVAGLAELEWASAATFFATDDWTGTTRRAAWLASYEEAFDRVGRSGRAVAAVSQPILDRIAPTGPSALVPNGLEPQEWRTLPDAHPTVAAIPGPRLVYVGTLDSRLDTEVLTRLSHELPDCNIVLVGPIGEEAALAPLREAERIHVLPPVKRAGLIATLAAADVGIVPHRETRLTRSMSPLKLYEYLAAGLPVAATDLQPMRGISEHVHLANGAVGWPEAVRAALQQGRLDETERLSFVSDNSWRSRQDVLLHLASRGALGDR